MRFAGFPIGGAESQVLLEMYSVAASTSLREAPATLHTKINLHVSHL